MIRIAGCLLTVLLASSCLITDDGASKDSQVVYVNFGGATVHPADAAGDVTANKTALVDETTVLAPWTGSSAEVATVMDCIRSRLEPFNVDVVSEDPAEVGAHIEIVLTASRPDELSNQEGLVVLASRRVDCQPQRNAMAIVLDPAGTEKVACRGALEVLGTTLGLDHVVSVDSLMGKWNSLEADVPQFRDAELPCGFDSARECACGGSQLNPYSEILDRLGPAEPAGLPGQD